MHTLIRLLAFVALSITLSCSPKGLPLPKSLPTSAQVAAAREEARMVRALAGQALPVVRAEVERLSAGGVLEPNKADQARAALAKVDLVLAKTDAWLKGKANAPGREELLEAIDAAALAVAIVEAAGGSVPSITAEAIRLARDVVKEEDGG